MRKIKILDCTLRDGGFVNDWSFGDYAIRDIIQKLDMANIDIIEIGYIDGSVSYNKDRTRYPGTSDSPKYLKNIGKPNAMVVAMIDYGTCPIENIGNREDSVLDGIRITFKKDEIDDALLFLESIKDLGYKVFAQPVSLTTYTDSELLSLLEKINTLQPYAISIVDTYGLMFKDDLIHYFYLINHNVDVNICIGYHSHNNFQLAFANCTELVQNSGIKRDILLDTSIYGMGKRAGNAQTELLANYLNMQYTSRYNLDFILDLIENYIKPIYSNKPWGYSMEYFLAAQSNCHPSYISYLLEQGTLSIKSINEILSQIEPSTRLTYDKGLIENLYISYQTHTINDENAMIQLKNMIANRNILLLAPGKCILDYATKIEDYCKENDPFILSINFIPMNYKADCVFVCNPLRYGAMLDQYIDVKFKPTVMATSNIVPSHVPIDLTFNFESLLEDGSVKIVNSGLMLLRLLRNIGIKKIALAGFDGYTGQDYFIEQMQTLSTITGKDEKNRVIKEQLASMRNEMQMVYITPSYYN